MYQSLQGSTATNYFKFSLAGTSTIRLYSFESPWASLFPCANTFCVRGVVSARLRRASKRLDCRLWKRDLFHQQDRKGKIVMIKTSKHKGLVFGFVFRTWNCYDFSRRSWGLSCTVPVAAERPHLDHGPAKVGEVKRMMTTLLRLTSGRAPWTRNGMPSRANRPLSCLDQEVQAIWLLALRNNLIGELLMMMGHKMLPSLRQEVLQHRLHGHWPVQRGQRRCLNGLQCLLVACYCSRTRPFWHSSCHVVHSPLHQYKKDETETNPKQFRSLPVPLVLHFRLKNRIIKLLNHKVVKLAILKIKEFFKETEGYDFTI